MKKLFRWILILGLSSFLLGIITIAVTYFVIAPTLPSVETIQEVQLQVPLRVYTKDGQLIGVFGEKRRIPVSIDEIPDHLKQAFIAGEDARFYEHPGVDYQGISRAVWTLVSTGEKSIGGSTITQQLARNFFLSFEKTFTRKIKEIFLALKIERALSKEKILELYMNKIFLGYRAYGVGAAAEVYYGKTLDELTLAQAAMIAALPKAPSRINPISQPERALNRRNYVLNRMLELEYIDQAEYDQAIAEKDLAFYHGANAEVSAPYLAEMVRTYALEHLGDQAYTGGYKIYTTINSRRQTAANMAVIGGLEAYDQRHGFRGPESHIDLNEQVTTESWDAVLRPFRPVAGLQPGLVIEADEVLALVYLQDGQTVALDQEGLAWSKPFVSRDQVGDAPTSVTDVLTPGDVIRLRLNDGGSWVLGQLPEVQGSLVSIDPQTGAVQALVGGYDFTHSKFNRVTQSRRQPGSSFKPFVYSAALEQGFTTASMVNDAPVVFHDSELERTWKPQNFSERFYGPTRLREAMVNSRNLVSIRLLRDIGIEYAREYISEFGFALEDLPADLSMALGSASLTPISMAQGYSTFANGGYRIEPFYIDRIMDSDNQTIYQASQVILCDDCQEQELLADLEGEDSNTEPEYRPLAVSINTSEENSEEAATEATGISLQNPDEFAYPGRAISPQNAYLVRSMMMDVVRRGTGVRAMQLGRTDLAGKTGTTNDQRDAWFSGYNSELVTTVWVGFDNHQPLGRGELGGRAALPIWIDYMGKALDGVEDLPPELPDGLSQARINPETGLLTQLNNPNAIMEIFQAGRLPDMEEFQDREDPNAIEEENPYDIF